MNETNLSAGDAGRYAPPLADLGPASGPAADAMALEAGGRWRRFGAAMIDGLLQSALVWGVLLGVLGWHFADVAHGSHQVVLVVLSLATYVALQGWLLANHGQTIGKRLLGLRIVDRQGGPVPLLRVLGLRMLPISVLSVVPIAGPALSLVDCLMIFRASRRTLHDVIARTQVVTAQTSTKVYGGSADVAPATPA